MIYTDIRRITNICPTSNIWCLTVRILITSPTPTQCHKAIDHGEQSELLSKITSKFPRAKQGPATPKRRRQALHDDMFVTLQ